MAPRKLSEAEKQNIIHLYRQPEESTSTLASRYGVSNSTISRILKQGLPGDEYETLVQQKRSGAFKLPLDPDLDVQLDAVDPGSAEARSPLPTFVPEPPPFAPPKKSLKPLGNSSATTASGKPVPSRRRIGSPVPDDADRDRANTLPASQQLPLLEDESPFTTPSPRRSSSQRSNLGLPQEMLEEIQADLRHSHMSSNFTPEGDLAEDDDDIADEDLEDEDLEEDDDLDEDDLDEDDLDDEDVDSDAELEGFAKLQVKSESFVRILPFADATLPKTCYLVVDRTSELVVRPLKEFAELGRIPSEEVHAKTLPVFDNHRVARRFSKRMQRIIKVPDGKMLRKAGPYLQAKGITRLLIDGQIYAI